MRTRFLSQRSHDCRSLTEETLKRCDEWLPWKPYRRVGAISFESVFTEERDETKQSGKARRSTFQRFVDERNRACQHPVTVVPCNLTPTSWTSSWRRQSRVGLLSPHSRLRTHATSCSVFRGRSPSQCCQ